MNLTLESIAEAQAADAYFSLGLHPWIDPATMDGDFLSRLAIAAARPNVLAIGECGIDRMTETPLAKQLKIFAEHVTLSEELNKPMVIHCVRAFDELIRIRESMKCSVPMILHGFNKGAEIAASLLGQGFFLSFGHALLRPGSNAAQVIRECSDDRIFLETDDSAISISEIYRAAAGLLGTDTESLAAVVYTNFKRVFHA